jgi:hypothetical protein
LGWPFVVAEQYVTEPTPKPHNTLSNKDIKKKDFLISINYYHFQQLFNVIDPL